MPSNCLECFTICVTKIVSFFYPLGEWILGPVAVVVFFTCAFGSLGGLGALYVSRTEIPTTPSSPPPQKITWTEAFCALLIGAVGALGFLFFTLAVGGITESVETNTEEKLRLIATSVISGFGARRMLPRMVGSLEKQIAQANQDASEAKSSAANASSQVKQLEDELHSASQKISNMRIREKLNRSIDSPVSDRIWKQSLEDAKAAIQNGTASAGMWIDAARVEARRISPAAAIETLTAYIKHVQQDKLQLDQNFPTALYNRACYRAKLYSESKKHSDLQALIEDLRSIKKASAYPEAFADLMETDKDFEALKGNDDFQATKALLRGSETREDKKGPA